MDDLLLSGAVAGMRPGIVENKGENKCCGVFGFVPKSESAFAGVCYEHFGRAVWQTEQPPLNNRQRSTGAGQLRLAVDFSKRDLNEEGGPHAARP
jgi:hypothetical protein